MSNQTSDKLKIDLNRISLEADVAYFEARIELVGRPKTYYQLAQLRVYHALEESLEKTLEQLRKQ
jgi:hypothetical protein